MLLEHPCVKDVRVVSLPDPRFGRKVVAVVQADGAPLTVPVPLPLRVTASATVPRRSSAPMSQPTPCGRAMPRWSVGTVQATASSSWLLAPGR